MAALAVTLPSPGLPGSASSASPMSPAMLPCAYCTASCANVAYTAVAVPCSIATRLYGYARLQRVSPVLIPARSWHLPIRAADHSRGHNRLSSQILQLVDNPLALSPAMHYTEYRTV